MTLPGKKGQIGVRLINIKDTLGKFILFVGNKLRNYPSLSGGEQMAYASIGVGIILVLVSVLMFVI